MSKPECEEIPDDRWAGFCECEPPIYNEAYPSECYACGMRIEDAREVDPSQSYAHPTSAGPGHDQQKES